jgi:hypothetical protein
MTIGINQNHFVRNQSRLPKNFLSSPFISLPVGLRSSMSRENTIFTGTLKAASRSATRAQVHQRAAIRKRANAEDYLEFAGRLFRCIRMEDAKYIKVKDA